MSWFCSLGTNIVNGASAVSNAVCNTAKTAVKVVTKVAEYTPPGQVFNYISLKCTGYKLTDAASGFACDMADDWNKEVQFIAKDPLHRVPGLGKYVEMLDGSTTKEKLKNKISRSLTAGKVALAAMGSGGAVSVLTKLLVAAIKGASNKVVNVARGSGGERAALNKLVDDNPQYHEVMLFALQVCPATAAL